MRDVELTVPADDASHLTWVRTRLSLDKDFLESVRYGFSLIVAGFGSFALFEGLTIGEREVASLPRTFAQVVTVFGILVILLAVQHARKMEAWVDADEYGTGPTPELPNENRTLHLAAAAVIIGVVSFVAMLLLPA
jgi:uncharacterized membrane protein YidH (DUF202 family)